MATVRLLSKTVTYEHASVEEMALEDQARYRLIRQTSLPLPSPISREELIELESEAKWFLRLKTHNPPAYEQNMNRLDEWIQPKVEPDSCTDINGGSLPPTIFFPEPLVLDDFFRVQATERTQQPIPLVRSPHYLNARLSERYNRRVADLMLARRQQAAARLRAVREMADEIERRQGGQGPLGPPPELQFPLDGQLPAQPGQQQAPPPPPQEQQVNGEDENENDRQVPIVIEMPAAPVVPFRRWDNQIIAPVARRSQLPANQQAKKGADAAAEARAASPKKSKKKPVVVDVASKQVPSPRKVLPPRKAKLSSAGPAQPQGFSVNSPNNRANKRQRAN